MAASLREYLAECSRRPFQWGTFDCCTFAADWIFTNTGWDPMADLRGRYSSEFGALRLIREAGGLENLLSARMGRCVGRDVPLAAVLTYPGQEPACAIPVGARWAHLTPDGVSIVAPTPDARIAGFR